MRFIYTLSFLLCLGAQQMFAQNPATLKTTQLSHWVSPDDIPLQWGYIAHNSCWGYAAPNGREYAILGGTDRIQFIDVTNPASPNLVATFMGEAPTVWREFKSYKNRIYAVADNSNEGLMIFDMTGAPNQIKRSYYSNEFFGSSHTITMDTTRGVIFLNSSVGCIGMLDVSVNPDKPTFIGGLPLTNICSPHDSYYENNKLFVSNGDAGLEIYDVTNLLAPKLLATESTGGYNHSGCTDKTGRYFYYLEEIPRARPGQVVDLQNLAQGDVERVGTFFEPLLAPAAQDAVYHNPFRTGDLLHVAAYEDGLVVFDISNPVKPTRVAWFDPSPNTTYNGYTGVWSVYPWLPSGNIIVGDMVRGLYMVKLDASLTSTQNANPEVQMLEIAPNPTSDLLQISLPESLQNGKVQYQIHHIAGRQVSQGTLQSSTLQVNQLNSGVYFLQLRSEAGDLYRAKFVKQ
jgi:choice-of-anchor B domain-containing protein